MSPKTSKARLNPRLVRLKDCIRQELGRDLTQQEERLIELSAALLESEDVTDPNDDALAQR